MNVFWFVFLVVFSAVFLVAFIYTRERLQKLQKEVRRLSGEIALLLMRPLDEVLYARLKKAKREGESRVVLGGHWGEEDSSADKIVRVLLWLKSYTPSDEWSRILRVIERVAWKHGFVFQFGQHGGPSCFIFDPASLTSGGKGPDW